MTKIITWICDDCGKQLPDTSMVHYSVSPDISERISDLCVECASEELEKQARKLRNADLDGAHHSRPCIICKVSVNCSVTRDASTHWVCPACATRRIKELEKRVLDYEKAPFLSQKRLDYYHELEVAAQAIWIAHELTYDLIDSDIDPELYALMALLKQHQIEQQGSSQ